MEKERSIEAYGLRILMPGHPAVRSLKKDFRPSNHGHKVWSSSWLLIDYLQSAPCMEGRVVLELGCGWGLSGIYCAKQLRATVICTDGDNAVAPFVNLMAETNQVAVDFRQLAFDQINGPLLQQVDMVIASDVCFCDTLIDPLRRLIHRAKRAGVRQIVVADPGRWPFDDLAEMFVERKGVQLVELKVLRPYRIAGKILSISLWPNRWRPL